MAVSFSLLSVFIWALYTGEGVGGKMGTIIWTNLSPPPFLSLFLLPTLRNAKSRWTSAIISSSTQFNNLFKMQFSWLPMALGPPFILSSETAWSNAKRLSRGSPDLGISAISATTAFPFLPHRHRHGLMCSPTVECFCVSNLSSPCQILLAQSSTWTETPLQNLKKLNCSF